MEFLSQSRHSFFLLSFRLKPDHGRSDVRIDFVGVLLAAIAIIFISFGFNNLNSWGLAVARTTAPFNVLGASPAPIMIVLGIVLGQAFFLWTRRREAAGRTPLLPLEVLDSPQGRAAVYAMFTVVALEAALNFPFRCTSRSYKDVRRWPPRLRCCLST